MKKILYLFLSIYKGIKPNCFYIFCADNFKVWRSNILLKKNLNSFNRISTFIYKRCADVVSPLISKIFNESIITVVFSHRLKIARITSIFKAVSLTQTNIKRHISMLPIFSIFKKINSQQTFKVVPSVSKNILTLFWCHLRISL